jgi:hypothetical protein
MFVNVDYLNQELYKLYRQNLDFLKPDVRQNPIYQLNCFRNAVMTLAYRLDASVDGDIYRYERALFTLKDGKQFMLINRQFVDLAKY